jgi:hypothetical protein
VPIAGHRNAALEQYRRCREVVREELDAEPMVETPELYQAILEGRFAVRRAPEVLPVQILAIEPSAPSGRSPLDVIAPSPLVGREQEMVFLRECWRGIEAGQGGLVLISGEAGVGKTRLLEEFANRLRWQGVRVLWGRCYEFERVLPYQPVAEALRVVIPTVSPAELAQCPPWALGIVPQAPAAIRRPFGFLKPEGSGRRKGRRMAESSPVPLVSTFVIRFWQEWSAAGPRWRGRIEHVQSGESVAFLNLDGMLDFPPFRRYARR